MIILLGLLLFNRWQSPMSEGSIATSNLSKMLMEVSSRLSLLTLPGTPVISRHSSLEYWLFPQYCLFNATTHLCNLLLAFLRQATLIQCFRNRCEVWLVLCWCWIKCYQILSDILKSMRSLHLLLVFLKQPQRVTYAFAKQVYRYLLAAKILSINKITSAHLGTSAKFRDQYSEIACIFSKNIKSSGSPKG